MEWGRLNTCVRRLRSSAEGAGGLLYAIPLSAVAPRMGSLAPVAPPVGAPPRLADIFSTTLGGTNVLHFVAMHATAVALVVAILLLVNVVMLVGCPSLIRSVGRQFGARLPWCEAPLEVGSGDCLLEWQPGVWGRRPPPTSQGWYRSHTTEPWSWYPMVPLCQGVLWGRAVRLMKRMLWASESWGVLMLPADAGWV
jgi:hypothetical protein